SGCSRWPEWLFNFAGIRNVIDIDPQLTASRLHQTPHNLGVDMAVGYIQDLDMAVAQIHQRQGQQPRFMLALVLFFTM
ncbi:hypothetical protein, partial [Aeromonas veronii]|uniref:hypothetical protein n=1 Tax=Aeromonas veronii TaxID=654 RepID=UPI002B475487